MTTTILACKAAYWWATAAGCVGVAWAIAFALWAFWHHGGEFGIEFGPPDQEDRNPG